MNSLVQSMSGESLTRLSKSLLMSPKVATKVSWLLLLIIIVMLSLLSWKVWDYFQPGKAIKADVTSSSGSVHKAAKLNIRKLMTYHLFGDSKTTTKIISGRAMDAPVTRLKLKLRGVYSSSDETLAGAMIEAQNKQQVYRVGSKLPGAAGLKLHKILSDRVIMSRGEKFETLLIEDFAQQKGKSRNISTRTPGKMPDMSALKPRSTNSNTIDKRNDSNLTRELLKLRGKLSDPQSLSELVTVSPARDGDEFQGFRLAPGKNRALFGRLGLRRNDVVTSVNGISLDNPASAFSLMEQIRTADEISLTVKRGDKELNILFSAQSQ